MYLIHQQLDKKKKLIHIIRKMVNMDPITHKLIIKPQYTVYTYMYCTHTVYIIQFYLYFSYTDTFMAGELGLMLKYN